MLGTFKIMKLVTSLIWIAGGFIWAVNAIESPEQWWNYLISLTSFILGGIYANSFDKQLRK